MNRKQKIYVAGHGGLVGSALVRALRKAGYDNLVLRTHGELDLTNQAKVQELFESEQPQHVFLAAAKVGGIWANYSHPAEFVLQNLQMQSNIIDSARKTGVERLLFLGSSCVYPKLAPQPITEESLLSGPLEPTNRPYAVAKIAGIEACWACNRQYGTLFLAAMPPNVYGPGDNYDLENSHVLPALLRKMHEAKVNEQCEVVLWGTGTPLREFLYSDDLADACVFLMKLNQEKFDHLVRTESVPPLINIGSGQDQTIRELAELVAEVVGFTGNLRFDSSKPDGTPRKIVDVSRITALGWKPDTNLRDGIKLAYLDFLNRIAQAPGPALNASERR